MKYYCKCERCGNDFAEVDTSEVLTSFPPQYKYVCSECDYSGMTKSFRFKVDYLENIETPKIVNKCIICGGECKDNKEKVCEPCKTAVMYLRANLDKIK